MIYDPANPTYKAVVQVVEIRGDKIRLGIIADPEVLVHRQEVYDAIQRGGGEGDSSCTSGNPDGRMATATTYEPDGVFNPLAHEQSK